MRRPAAVALLAVAALGCAFAERLLAPPALGSAPTSALAEVSVEVSGGLVEVPRWREAEMPVEIVIDATLSMDAPVARQVTRYDAARQLAARYLGALPAATPASLRVLGITSGRECGAAVPIEPPAGNEAVKALARLVATLPPPRGESSLAAALGDVESRLSRTGAGAARVVVLSDLEPACDGDLCAAARALVEAGAELEIVGLGDHAPPECLASVAAFAAPELLARGPRRSSPAFRVEALVSTEAGEITTQLVARGRANAAAASLPAGRVVVTVELDPPASVGPLDVNPGESVRLRVLDFPALEPPAREVWVEGGRRLDDESGLETETPEPAPAGRVLEPSPAAPEKSES